MISRRVFVGCCCFAASLQYNSVRARTSILNRLPANRVLKDPICHAGLFAQRYKGDGLLTSDKQTPPGFDDNWGLVAKAMSRDPYFGLVDDNPDQPIIGTYLFERDKPVVVIGTTFLSKMTALKEYSNEIQIGCLAHEFGHVIQYTSKCGINFHSEASGEDVFRQAKCMDNLRLPARTSPVIIELQADFLGGWLLGRKGLLTTAKFQGFARFIFSLGETFFGTAVHHGTPRQRLNAMAAGWVFGRDGTILNGVDVDGMLEQLHVDARRFQSVDVAFAVGEATIADFFEGCDNDECQF
jgi:hypothetical protein